MYISCRDKIIYKVDDDKLHIFMLVADANSQTLIHLLATEALLYPIYISGN